MPFDGIAMHAVISELKEKVLGSRITKIYQPLKDEVLIYFRNPYDDLKLTISVNPTECRIHLTQKNVENPATPPMFCMLLRKYLIGGRIRQISQFNLERLLEITIENNNEFMQPVEMKLFIEIMGKHSNIILADSGGTIIDSIKRVSSDINRFRQVLPGEKYVMPPVGNKNNLLGIDRNIIMSTFDSSVQKNPSKTVSKWIVDNFSGISGISAREMAYRAHINESKPIRDITCDELDFLVKTILELADGTRTCNFEPVIYLDSADNPEDIWVFPMLHKKEKPMPISGVNNAVDFYYAKKAAAAALERLKNHAREEVSRHLKKVNQNLLHIKKTLEKTEEMEKYRLWGEILYANLYCIKSGEKEVKLPNFYNPGEEIIIPLQEKYTPARNAQIYFNRYKKMHSARIISETRMQEALDEINYLENILVNIQNSENVEDINDIYQELENQGYMKNPVKKNMEKAKSEPLKFKSSEGYTIYVGKNNRQNDLLTLKHAKPGDIWLHTKDIPGSHVIIDCHGKDVSEKTIIEAGILAAYFSKARNGSNVPVDYTLKKYVRKPSGAKPGFVIYDHQKTIYVTPDEETIKKLSF
ncbi:MAG TPA: fibronectin/fibrinogen-binding protein [Thermoanaerobacterales bacterium]|nr:fibronectin/fibrinogen-binding protein [Thermoanaerobacterales bacterium]